MSMQSKSNSAKLLRRKPCVICTNIKNKGSNCNTVHGQISRSHRTHIFIQSLKMCALNCFCVNSQAVESLALLACENVDHIDSEPMPSADGDIPDLLTPISHSGVSLFILVK